jgi:cation diffusion facilitator CzcD-associated flavoprotein CzcO
VVTDEIETFTEQGIALKSGQQLDADIIVTATGLRHERARRHRLHGRRQAAGLLADTVSWRGMMFTGVPNLSWVFGYFRASWTLRVDLIADFVCRLLQHDARPRAPRAWWCRTARARIRT